jgi:hypothetical protein
MAASSILQMVRRAPATLMAVSPFLVNRRKHQPLISPTQCLAGCDLEV